MAANYWLWRVSEGGLVEQFKSAGSTMPAWKEDLSACHLGASGTRGGDARRRTTTRGPPAGGVRLPTKGTGGHKH
jgi:hypothetical protein